MKSTSLESSGQYGNMCNVAHFANYQKSISACCSSGHREALSDIFDVIDVDGNGLLSLEEYNFFELRTSGEKCDKDAWLVCKGHHFSMTYTGCVYLCRCVWKNDQERSTKTHLFCFVFVGRAENFDMRKNQLTRQGFMELNLMEATEKEGDPADLWISLEAMGYNRMLELVHVCVILWSLLTVTLKNVVHILA